MPLPPIPTQIAGQVKISSKDTPNLKKRPAPAKTVAMESHAPDWATDAEEDLSAAEVALEKIKGDRRPAAARSERSESKVASIPEKPKRIIRTGPPSLFVLDTNVLMHDPSSLFRFSEHDLFLPMTTLEELDNHKKGMTEVARNARTVSRSLDQLVAGTSGTLDEGIPLNKLGNQDVSGRLFFQTKLTTQALPEGLPEGKGDNLILAVVSELQKARKGQEVVLVSKDINMRIKARALGLPAEDYFNDQVLEDRDLMYSGVMALPADFWPKHGKDMESWADGKSGTMFYRVTGPSVPSMLVNEFVYQENPDGSTPFYAQVKEINGKTALLQTLRDFSHQKNNVWSVTARNREQNFAMNLLMNPDVDFITLLGQAGTGKTLLALAAGLEQVLDSKRYNEIIITRATVPVGEDIGFLPGTEEEKMQPWMGAFDDNLEVLQRNEDGAGEWGRAATQELIRSRIKVKSMNFMRGRTFVSKFVIIDEAQNLTPKQMKTLVTRAGPGTKIVCLGNIAQIDTPYLTEGSSGLTYVVDRFKGWRHGGHVTLARGERSRLADHAADAL
ncbi:MAG: PhoH family protein [Polynucleobacter sp.]|jgi:PhoH-like ATPase|nr:PhoH family protein [uncultured Polynucleobacter sp.]AGG33962.1 PhoH family protein [beta proteobacterium CB]MBP7943672.1 PhoH family protein [Polynucleobacter sp.]